RARTGNVTIVSAGFTIDRILDKFAEFGVVVHAKGDVRGSRIDSFIVRDVPKRQALEDLVASKPDWLLYEPMEAPGTDEIWAQEHFREQVLPRQAKFKVFQPKYISAEDATKELSPNLTPKIGKANYDLHTNKIFVTDLP